PEELESPYFKIQSTLEPHNLVETSKIILQATSSVKALQKLDINCNFCALNDLVVWEREKYYIMYRREPIRGLLFVPRPSNDEKNNFNHFDNTSLIKNQLFWQDLISVQLWQQARSDDKYMQSCHAKQSLNNCLELERFRLQIVESQKVQPNLQEWWMALSVTNAKLSHLDGNQCKQSQLVDLLTLKEQLSNAKKD
ncbi:1267_t:CDS:2, partial [Ambispora leptoticha]